MPLKRSKMLLNSPFNKILLLIPILVVGILPMASIAQWTVLNSGTTESLNEIVFAASDTGFVVGANGTLLRTFTGGDQWTALDIGSTLHLNDIYFHNTQTGYVVGDSGLFSVTFDAGENWSTSYLASSVPIHLSAVCFTSLMTGYVGGRNDDVEGIIYKTIDGGSTWVEKVTPESILDRDYKRLVFPTPDVGYALTRGMCIKTTDGGENWFITDSALVSSGDMFSILEDAYFFSADTGYIVGWYNGFSGYTVNGGEKWIDQFVSQNQWHSIDFPSRQTGYLGGWGQLMKTEDGGETWTNQTSELISNGSIYSMDFTDEVTGYMCGAEGLILKTTNGDTTSLYDPSISSDLIISPNPSMGEIEISMSKEIQHVEEQMSMMLYNMMGEKVLLASSPSLPTIINLENLPKGFYVLVASTAQAQYVQKLILQ